MEIYLFIVLPFFLYSILDVTSKDLNKKGFLNLTYFFVLFFVAIVIGSRTAIDNDFNSYLNIYNLVPSFSRLIDLSMLDDIHGEYGYLILNSIFKTMGLSFSTLLIVITVFSLFVKFFYASRLTDRAYLCMLVYFSFSFYLVEFIQFRWALSISFGIIALYENFNGNKLLSIALVFLGACFHFYIFLLLPFILFSLHKFFVFYRPIFLIVLGAAGICFSVILGWSNIIYILQFISTDLTQEIYKSKYFDAGGVSITLVLYYVLQFITCIILYHHINPKKSASIKTSYVYAIYIYLSLIQFIFLFSSVLSQRIYGLISFFLGLLLSNFINQSKKKLYLYIFVIFVVTAHVYMTYRNIFDVDAILKYNSVIL